MVTQSSTLASVARPGASSGRHHGRGRSVTWTSRVNPAEAEAESGSLVPSRPVKEQRHKVKAAKTPRKEKGFGKAKIARPKRIASGKEQRKLRFGSLVLAIFAIFRLEVHVPMEPEPAGGP
ncbi:unnamed protein product [Symbiodinium sp. CCMP2592]|nr:unnamed protein product [Symbiodinium sp. CCMP2592]